MEVPPDNPGARVVGMGHSGGELFSNSCCNFYVAVEGFGFKGDRLIGKGSIKNKSRNRSKWVFSTVEFFVKKKIGFLRI